MQFVRDDQYYRARLFKYFLDTVMRGHSNESICFFQFSHLLYDKHGEKVGVFMG